MQTARLHPQRGGLAWRNATASTPIAHDEVELSIDVMFFYRDQIAIKTVRLIFRMAEITGAVTFRLEYFPIAQNHQRLTRHLVPALAFSCKIWRRLRMRVEITLHRNRFDLTLGTWSCLGKFECGRGF